MSSCGLQLSFLAYMVLKYFNILLGLCHKLYEKQGLGIRVAMMVKTPATKKQATRSYDPPVV